MRGPKPSIPAATPRTPLRGGTQSESANASLSSQRTIQEGLSLIQRGNEYFFSDCYLEAIGYYYQAAMLLRHNPEYQVQRSKAWSNVAECHLRLQNWSAAEEASSRAIAADPKNKKALYRRAKARFEWARYVGAAQDADAVGTEDAQNVAALCRELAQGMGQQQQQQQRDGADDNKERISAPITTNSSASTGNKTHRELAERSMWLRRIIDSYRLRVDDEYTQTGASDAGSLYGIRAKGGTKPPLDHFKAYVRRALKKRVLPGWFTTAEMETICRVAMADDFSNINQPVHPDEIMEYYGQLGFPNEKTTLRDLAVFIEGPIGMPWTNNANTNTNTNTNTNHSKARKSWNPFGSTAHGKKKCREQAYPGTPQRQHNNQYNDPALMDKNSPYPYYPTPTMTKSRGSHYYSYATPTTNPNYNNRNNSMPFTPASSKRESVYPAPSRHSSFEQQRSYCPSEYQTSMQGMIQASWASSFPEDDRAPSPVPEEEQQHYYYDEERSGGSYGPQLPAYGGRHVPIMSTNTNGSSKPQPYYYNGPEAQQYLMSHPNMFQWHQQQQQHYHPAESRDPEDGGYDYHDNGGQQQRAGHDDTSTARSVRNGEFAEQVFSDLTEISP